MSAPSLETTVQCAGCKRSFRNAMCYMNHAKNAKDCTPEKRFWGRVRKTRGCWRWTGFIDLKGYGDLTFRGKHVQSHRLAWTLLKGHPGKLDVLHKCGERNCCNPAHLYLGTDKDNARDRVMAGTHLRGEEAYNARLTAADVHEIRRLKGKVSGYKLAKQYGVGQPYISQIQSRRVWKHI